MITTPTVLVLGAGASQPYGFPGAYKLVKEICNTLDNEANHDFQTLTRLGCKRGTILRFVDALKEADPISVDTWLEHNPGYIELVGKAAIAQALLKFEHNTNWRPTPNWYNHLFWLLTFDISFNDFNRKNNLSIITFNYDRSLEQFFFNKLNHHLLDKEPKEIAKMIKGMNIIHVHGSLGSLDWPDTPPRPVPYGSTAEHSIQIANQEIKVIPENVEETSEFEQAYNLLCDAKYIYFLGFGYHKPNLKRLKLHLLSTQHDRDIFGTSKGLSITMKEHVEAIKCGVSDPGCADKITLCPTSIYEFIYEKVNLAR